ncbi:MAG: 50S ribosomal protein L10 [Candidatus Aenigmatarchaeota archaeon]
MTSDKKIKIVSQLKKDINEATAIGIVNLHKMPAKQLQKMKVDLVGRAKIKVTRKSLIERSLKGSEKKDLEKLVERMKGSPALLLTKENPFKIYSYLKKNKSNAAAKAGDIVGEDMHISKGPTQIAPGPAMSQLQAVGLKTGVEGGKIKIMNDKTVLKKDGVVTQELAAVFNMLGMEPIKIGLDVNAFWEDGTIYDKNILDVDQEQYYDDIISCVRNSLNLSLNAGYITNDNVSLAIAKAFREARSLAIAANVLTADTIGDVLAKAVAEAKAVEKQMKPVESTKTEDTQNVQTSNHEVNENSQSE